MVPLYAARIEDLGPGDFVKVECLSCRHVELLPAPVASGWSDVAGWALHPLESAALSRRTPEGDVRDVR
jgi:hypothetical protein